MNDFHAPLELSRAYPHESNAVAVRWIHVGLNLKDETGKVIFIRAYFSCCCRTDYRRRSNFNKSVEQFLDTEIVNGAAEENGRLAGFQIFLELKGIGRAFKQGDFFA